MRVLKIGLVAVLFCAGCKARDADILAEVFRRASQKVATATGNAPGYIGGGLRDSMGGASLSARVHNRIHHDRYLTSFDIQVSTLAAGSVTLTGNVPNLAIKHRILDLAKSTVGVQNVEDRLVLPAEE
jgi:osmotically-inducible protein OsmY